MDESEMSKDMGVSNEHKLHCFGGNTLKGQYLFNILIRNDDARKMYVLFHIEL